MATVAFFIVVPRTDPVYVLAYKELSAAYEIKKEQLAKNGGNIKILEGDKKGTVLTGQAAKDYLKEEYQKTYSRLSLEAVLGGDSLAHDWGAKLEAKYPLESKFKPNSEFPKREEISNKWSDPVGLYQKYIKHPGDFLYFMPNFLGTLMIGGLAIFISLLLFWENYVKKASYTVRQLHLLPLLLVPVLLGQAVFLNVGGAGIFFLWLVICSATQYQRGAFRKSATFVPKVVVEGVMSFFETVVAPNYQKSLRKKESLLVLHGAVFRNRNESLLGAKDGPDVFKRFDSTASPHALKVADALKNVFSSCTSKGSGWYQKCLVEITVFLLHPKVIISALVLTAASIFVLGVEEGAWGQFNPWGTGFPILLEAQIVSPFHVVGLVLFKVFLLAAIGIGIMTLAQLALFVVYMLVLLLMYQVPNFLHRSVLSLHVKMHQLFGAKHQVDMDENPSGVISLIQRVIEKQKHKAQSILVQSEEEGLLSAQSSRELQEKLAKKEAYIIQNHIKAETSSGVGSTTARL